ncbi:MAG: sensor histidine kinase [Bacteroidota bacterium]|nr:two-component sensor histidine kinase [bacterium]NBP63796.1 two-component sensor histidine kinase [Bacteroidota bacterium]
MFKIKGPIESSLHKTAFWLVTMTCLIIGILLYAMGSSMQAFPLLFLMWIGTNIVLWLMIRIIIHLGIVQPLRDLLASMNSFIGGISTARVDSSNITSFEIKELADAFNGLAEKSSKDISELKKLEQVRSQFLGNVSHELRTPIFSIQGYLETLLDGALEDPAVRRKFIERSHANAVRLNLLLSDLIDISKIESGEMRMSYRYFNIVEMIQDVLHSLEYQAQQYKVELITAFDQDEVSVYGDKERLSQALTNLVENAMKYNKPGGSVTVELRLNTSIVNISVKDTGIGIAEEHKDRIFERFYRVDKDRSRSVGGTGLGLAIVKHILEAHQTSPMVESVPGEGTSISFSLKI